MAVHPAEDEEEDEEIHESEPRGVESPQVWLQTVADRGSYTAEVDDFAQQVGRDGVHAIHLQPLQAADVPLIINPVVEQSHEQEATASGKEGHAAGPQPLDDWHL